MSSDDFKYIILDLSPMIEGATVVRWAKIEDPDADIEYPLNQIGRHNDKKTEIYLVFRPDKGNTPNLYSLLGYKKRGEKAEELIYENRDLPF
jgi:hypothetical protein